MAKNNISRRTFAIGSAAALSSLFLPEVEGVADAFSTLPIGAARAFAADAQDSDTTEIMVVGRTQIGIVAYDVTNPQSLIALKNCKVKLTSLYNNKSLEATSDSAGRVIFDLEDLAEDKDADLIAFNGSMEVTCDGYRDVYIPRARFIAHCAMIAPTRPLDDKPYFRYVSMNGWDIQYIQNLFVTAPVADEQDVEIELWMPKKNMTPTAKLVALKNGKETTLSKFKFGKQSGNLIKGTTSGSFLQTGSSQLIAEGATLKVVFSFEESNDEFFLNSSLQTKASPLSQSEKVSKLFVAESQYNTSITGLDLPESMCAPFKGISLSFWRPRFNMIFDVSALGFVVFGYGYNKLELKEDNGQPFAGKFNAQPIEGFKNQVSTEWQRELKIFNDYMAQSADPNDETKTQLFTWKFVPTVTMTYLLQFYGKLEYVWDDKYWQGSLVFLAAFQWDALFTFRFTILGAPAYFQIHPWFEARVPLSIGMHNQDVWDFNFDFDGVEFGARATFGIGATLGIGCEGFVSTSGTIAGYICIYLSFTSSSHTKPWPRITAGYGCSGVVTVQLPFTKFSATLFKVDEPQAFDTNSSKFSSSLSDKEKIYGNLETSDLDPVLQQRLGKFANANYESAGTGDFPTYAQMKEMAVTVTNADMLAGKEFEVSTQADYENSPVKIFAQVDGELSSGPFNSWDKENSNSEIIVITKEDAAADIALTSVGTKDEDVSGAEVATNSSAPTKDQLKQLVEYEPQSNDYLTQYSYVGTMTSGNPTEKLGVGGISDANRGGVLPNIDRVMFKDVYSDSKMQLLVTSNNGATYLFRIVTVDIGGGKARSRLVYHRLNDNGNWSQPWVIDYDPQIEGSSRDDMYDYEFSVTQANANGGINYIFVIVTSNARPDGDDTDFDHNLQAHYATIVGLYDSYATENPLRVDPLMTASLPNTSEGYTLISPRITGFSDKFSIAGTNDFCVMGTYLRRSVGGEDGLSKDCTTMSFFARLELDETYTKKLFKVDTSVIHLNGDNALNDVVMLPIKIDDDSYKWEYGSVANCRRATFVYSGGETNGACKLEANYKDNDTTQFQSFVKTELANSYTTDLRVNKFYKFGNSGQVIATCATKTDGGEETSALFNVEFDPKNTGKMTFKQIGPVKGAVADFIPDGSGHYLFFVENVDGKVGQNYDEYGDLIDDGGVVEHRHYIMAVAFVDGLFTEPFIFAELDHIIDGLIATAVNGSYVTFMTSTIKNIDKSLADIYDVRVPILKCLTPVSLVCADAFAMSGEDNIFAVKVRNDGNLVATAATFTLYDENNDVVDSKHLSFADDMLNSARNINPDCGYDTSQLSSTLKSSKIVADDGLGVLLPGSIETYRMKFFIPQDWQDEHTVRIAISDVEVINPQDFSDENLHNYNLALRLCPTTTVNATPASLSKSVDSGEVYSKKKDSSNGGGSNANCGENESATPNTGDNWSSSMLGFALSAASAGMAAYTARRVANEKRKEKLSALVDTDSETK